MVVDVLVPRRNWNALQMSATLHGVEMWPQLPTDEKTTAQLTGSAEKIQASLVKKVNGKSYTWTGISIVNIRRFDQRDPEPERLM
jgi:hypothetical protein